MKRYRWVVAVPWLALLSLSELRADDPAPVQASLVAAETSVQPGRPFTVALRLQHAEHWHTYWRNPGTGLPTTLAWELPPGWRAGEIQWPAPIVLRDARGGIVATATKRTCSCR